jgi:diguanylate cyclase (GGDEF)-like protein
MTDPATPIVIHDALTGLPNHALLQDRLAQAIMRSKRSKKMVAVFFLGLEGFKQIIATMGQEAGDLVLKSVATSLVNAVRGEDTCACQEDDKFVLLFGDVESLLSIEYLIHKVQFVVAQPIAINDTFVTVTASIGITIYPEDGATTEILLSHAEKAMYTAKQHGDNQYRYFPVE